MSSGSERAQALRSPSIRRVAGTMTEEMQEGSLVLLPLAELLGLPFLVVRSFLFGLRL